MKNLENYRSLVIGTRDDCLSCKNAYAIDVHEDGLDLESSSQLKDIKNILNEKLSENNVLTLERLNEVDDNTEASIFGRSDLKRVYEFDMVIFGSLDNIAAVIKFTNIQTTSTLSDDIIENIKLKLSVKSNSIKEGESGPISLIVSFSGVSELKSKRTGIELYQFKSESYNIIPESYSKYTSRINQVLEDSDMAIISGECGIYGNSGSWGFWIRDYEDLEGFNKVGICFLNREEGTDICSLKFNTKSGHYDLTSLVKNNYYGNSKSYRSGRIIPESDKYKFYKILGSNIIYLSDSYYYVYSISDDISYKIPRVLNGFPNLLVSNPWDLPSPLKFETSSSIFKKLEVISTSDLSFDRGRDSFKESIGSWYKLDYGTLLEDLYVGPRGTIHDKTKKLIPISENLMLYTDGLRYSFVPRAFEITYVCKASDFISIKKNEEISGRKRKKLPPYWRDYFEPYNEKSISNIDKDNDLWRYENKDEVFEFKSTDLIIGVNSSYLNIDAIEIGTKYKDLNPSYRIILDGLRRKPFRITFPDPSTIIPFCGLIFYIEDNKLYLY